MLIIAQQIRYETNSFFPRQEIQFQYVQLNTPSRGYDLVLNQSKL